MTRLYAQPRPVPQIIAKRKGTRAHTELMKALRVAVFSRDQWKCRACQHRYAIHLHHLLYKSHGGKDTTMNCVALCKECHQEIHARLLLVTFTNADKKTGVKFHKP